MKYLEVSRLTQLTSDLTEAFLNTRGTGSGGVGGGVDVGNNGRNNRGSKNNKKHTTNNQKQQPNQKQQQHQSLQAPSTPAKVGSAQNSRGSTSPYLPSSTYAYNSAGYSSYGGVGNSNDGYSTSSSSCRVIYGRVEAYTTKRAGSDKKTAHEVGERYAHEMERLNEAVEELKRKHMSEKEKERGDLDVNQEDSKEGGHGKGEEELHSESKEGAKKKADKDAPTKKTVLKESQQQFSRRGRSRSVDGVTFAKSTSRIVSENNIGPLPDETVVASTAAPALDAEEDLSSHTAIGKRNLPLEGILKPPSSNKRWRAASFDISTGPSTLTSRYSKVRDPSPPVLEGAACGGVLPWISSTSDAFRSADDEDDKNTHPLIPQPSLYQSSLGDSGEATASLPTMVPRRLVTDLILTLNASFPDYDFGDARPSDFCTLSVPEAMRRINEKLCEFAATTDRGRDFLPRFWSSLDDVIFGLKDADVYSYAPRGGGGDDDPLGFLTSTLAGSNNGLLGNHGGCDDVTGDDCIVIPSSGGLVGEADSTMLGLDTSTTLDLPHHILPSPAVKSEASAHVTLWTMNYFFVSRNKKRIVLFACVQTMRTPQGFDEEEEGLDEYAYGENDLVFDEARRGSKQQEEEGGYTYPLMNATRAEFSLAGDESVMVEDDEEERAFRGDGADVDVDGDEDEDQDEDEFDMDNETGPGNLEGSVHAPSPPADRMEMA